VPKPRHRSLSPALLVCAAALLPRGRATGNGIRRPRRARARSRPGGGKGRSRRRTTRRPSAGTSRTARRTREGTSRTTRRSCAGTSRTARNTYAGTSRTTRGRTQQGAVSQTPTVEAPARGCSVTISTSSQRIVAGETVTISGAVACPNDSSAGSQQLVIAQDQPGSSPPSAATPLSTASDGSYSFTSAPLSATTVFRVRLGRHGAHVPVRVAPLVTLTGPAASTQASALAGAAQRGRRRASFTGTVDPYDAGARVGLQLSYPSSPNQWRTVAYGHVSATGSYSIAHNFISSGTMLLRAIAYGSKHKAPAVSQALPITPRSHRTPSSRSAPPPIRSPAVKR